jgi:hypothetical protein
MRPVVSIGAVLVLALFAVACGSDKKEGGLLSGNQATGQSGSPTTGAPGGGASNAKLLNPCDLFSKDDATAALGLPVKNGELKKGAEPLGQQMCFYGAADDRSPNSVQLSIVQTSGMSDAVRKGGQSAKTLHDGTKTAIPSAAPQAGIGQDAFIGSTSIYVLKGDTHFSILLFGNGRPGDASHTNALRTAATKVVSKVP